MSLRLTSLNEIKFIFFHNIPNFSSVILTSIMIGAVLIKLCKNAVNRAENTLHQQHRKALKETTPFVVFMIPHQVTIIMAMVNIACRLLLAEERKNLEHLFYGNAIICGL